MTATVVNIRTVRGVQLGCDVYIGRPSKWGNPFTITNVRDRDMAVDQYAEWIKTQPGLLACLPELKDKRLGCYCAPQRCHGDVLVALVNSLDTNHEDAHPP
jgi:Domain of unknown function (DUF4326)